MSDVYPSVASSGNVQIAVRSAPTPPMAAAVGKVRSGRRASHTTSAPTRANMPTTRWLITTAAKSTAGNHIRRRCSSEYARAPRKNNASARARVNENSPAKLLARFPPMMCWLPATRVASAPAPGAPLKNRRTVAPTANSAGAGRGPRRPRPNAYAAAGSAIGPNAVTSLNAMLYGSTASSATINRAGKGK